MAFDGLLITEIFYSLQGETSLSGIPFSFIRLTGCNLRCTYCDSAYAFKGGKKMSIDEVLENIKPHGVKNVLVTGGEPLLQRNTPALVLALKKAGYTVSIETSGESSIAPVRENARIILDVKTPGSGMQRGGWRENFPLLKKGDEVKFVITSESDYEWAKEFVQSGKIPNTCEILFSPAIAALGAPGGDSVQLLSSQLGPTWLAEQILKDRLPVRFQYQIHKLLWGKDKKGV